MAEAVPPEATPAAPPEMVTISGRWGRISVPWLVAAAMIGTAGSSWIGSRGGVISAGLSASQADSIAQHVADVAIRRSEAIQAVERGRVLERLDTIASQVSDLQVAFVHDRAHPSCPSCREQQTVRYEVAPREVGSRVAVLPARLARGE